jgi:epoxide hydrolase 4
MLLVHGFPEMWHSWRHQLAAFREEYEVVALDLRGYGGSDKPEGTEAYRVDKVVDDIRDLILELGHDKCVLVGHDW